MRGTILDSGTALTAGEDVLKNDGDALQLNSVKLLAPIDRDARSWQLR